MANLDSIRAGRVSKPSGAYAFEQLSWSVIRRSISLIEELTVEDADASDAVNNVQRLGNSGVRWLVVSPSPEIGKRAHDELESWASTLFAHRVNGGLYALVNYFLRQVVITGAGSAENKIAPERTHVADIYPVDVRSLEFGWSDKKDGYIVSQKYEGEETELPLLTYQYIPLSTPLSGNPYPLPPLYSALEETDNLRALLDAVKDGVTKQRLLGMLTLAIKRMAKIQGQTEEAWRKEQRVILNDVAEEFSKSLQDGLLVHFDEIEPGFLSFASEMSKAAHLSEPFERRTSRALNFAWIREHGTIASAYMSIILEKILAEIQAIQLIVAQVLNKAALQHLYMRGIPVISVRTSLDQDAIRVWDKVLKQVQAFKELMSMGVVDKYMVGRELGYTPPDTEETDYLEKEPVEPKEDEDINETNEEDNGKETKQSSNTSFDNYLITESDCRRYLGYHRIYKAPLHIQLIRSNKENHVKCIGSTTFPK